MDVKDEDISESHPKYVTVVYHHLSYQNIDGLQDGNDEKGEIQEKGAMSFNLVPADERQKRTPDIPDYLPLAILSAFVFVPFGVFAVMNGLKVRKAIQSEDIEKAWIASGSAIQHALSAIVTGPLVFLCVYFLIVFI